MEAEESHEQLPTKMLKPMTFIDTKKLDNIKLGR